MAKNLDVAFPFYDAVTEQYRYRDDCFAIPYIVWPALKPAPWIIRRTHSDGTNAQIELYFVPLDGGTTINVNGASASVSITTGTSYDYIWCSSNLPVALPLDSAGYYLKVVDTYPTVDVSYYSETFSVASSVSDLIYLEWKNSTQIAGILQDFIQGLYVNNTLKSPQYIREDTGDKRDGIVVKEKQVKYKDSILHMPVTPEYLVDALILLPMMDYVWVTPQGLSQTSYDEVRIPDPEWVGNGSGAYAAMEIHFIGGVVIKKLNFKESTTTTGTAVTAIIKTGGPVLTVASGDYYEYQVVFVDDMPDTNYKPDAVAVSTDAYVDAQIAKCMNITIHGFTILTVVECEVRWSATWSPES